MADLFANVYRHLTQKEYFQFHWIVYGHPVLAVVQNRDELRAGLNPPPLVRNGASYANRVSFHPIHLRLLTVKDHETPHAVLAYPLAAEMQKRLAKFALEITRGHMHNSYEVEKHLHLSLLGQKFVMTGYQDVPFDPGLHIDFWIAPTFIKEPENV